MAKQAFVWQHGKMVSPTSGSKASTEWKPPVTGRDILTRLNDVVRGAIAKKKEIDKMPMEGFTKEHAAAQRNILKQKSANETAVALNDLYRDLQTAKATSEKNRHYAKYPLLHTKDQADRLRSSQEYAAGTNIASSARTYPTRLLSEALRSGRIDFCTGILDTIELKHFDSPPSIEDAAKWQAQVDELRSQTGLASHDSELEVIGNAESLINNIVHVSGDTIQLDLSPHTLTAIGLAGLPMSQLDEDRNKPNIPAEGTPAWEVDELDRINEELKEARAQRATERINELEAARLDAIGKMELAAAERIGRLEADLRAERGRK